MRPQAMMELMWPGKQKQPPLLKGWYVHGNNLRGYEWSLRAFANISSTAIFFASTSRDKKFDLRAASSLESTTREQRAFLIFSACSNPYGNPFPYGVFILSAQSFLKQVWVTPSPHFYCFPSTFSSFLLFSLHLLLISIVIGGGGGGGGGWGGGGGGKAIEMMRREFKIEERK